MALLVHRGDFQITTAVATTVLPVRNVGFMGKVAIFWWNGRDGTADASGETDYMAGFGFAKNPTNRRCVGGTSQHNVATSVAKSAMYDTACIAVVAPGGTTVALADFGGFVSDGFDIVIDVAFPASLRVHYLILGGSDLTDVCIGTFAPAVGSNVELDVELGFQPAFLLSIGRHTPYENTVDSTAVLTFGVATGTGASEQFVCSQQAEDAAPTSDTKSICRSGWAVSSGTSNENATLAAFLPTGFRLSYPTSFGAMHYFLALKGGRYMVRPMLTSVTSAASIPVTAAGFTPKAALFVSACRSEDVAFATPLTMSIGCATGAAEQAALAFQDKNGSATMDCFTALDYDQVYVNPDLGATQAVEGLMALASMDDDGLTCAMTAGDPVAAFVGVVLFGDGPPSAYEDPTSGMLYRGAPLLYTDADGNVESGVLESAQATYGSTVDLAVFRVSGTSVVKLSLISVPHQSVATAPPYWVGVEGQRTSPPIISA